MPTPFFEVCATMQRYPVAPARPSCCKACRDEPSCQPGDFYGRVWGCLKIRSLLLKVGTAYGSGLCRSWVDPDLEKPRCEIDIGYQHSGNNPFHSPFLTTLNPPAEGRRDPEPESIHSKPLHYPKPCALKS